jgi:hypothetical protein
VVRRHLLAALSVGIDAGDDDAARASLARVDWIVRGITRRRLERVLIDAALATGAWTTSADPEATSHVMRVASLQVRGALDVDPEDRAAVARELATLPAAPAPSHRPILTVVAATLAALVLASVIAHLASGEPDTIRRYVRALPPPSAGAYQTGGTPLADPGIEALLRNDVADLVVVTDRAVNFGDISDPERVAKHAALMAPPAITRHGPGVAGAWTEMLAAFDHWAHLIPADPGWDRAVTELRTSARRVSDQLAALGLGYNVDADVVLGGGKRHGIIYAYRVEHVAFVKAANKVQRVLGLRRLDHIGVSRTLLGMQSEELGDPMLLLDQIDEHVATNLLPLLAARGDYPLGDARWRRTGWGMQLAAATGEAVRNELIAALGSDAEPARQVGELMADRGELFEQWREYLSLHDMMLRPVHTALLPKNYLPSLEPVMPAEERARMAALDERMAALGVPRIASRLHDLLAATVRRHEAQHAFDADRAVPLFQPTSLQMLVGPAEDPDGVERRLARRCRTELSAYVSQIASDPATPQLSLWALARSAFDESRWGRPESYVAIVVIPGLARELEIPSAGVIVHDGEIDRERLAKLGVAIAAVSDEDLRNAAARLWAQLFAETYIPLIDVLAPPAPPVPSAHVPPLP